MTKVYQPITQMGREKMERDGLMHRVAAAKTYIGTINNPEHQAEVELAAFMAIFHPEVSDDRVRQMRNSLRRG